MPTSSADTAVSFTAAEKLVELEREIAVRKRIYPKFIAQGSLSLNLASRRIDIMRAIAHDYFRQTLEQQHADTLIGRIGQSEP